MLGNVWEWCKVWFGDYPSDAVEEPTGPDMGAYRVIRGGSWNSRAQDVRAAYRHLDEPGLRSYYLGFRLLARGQAAQGGAEPR